MEKTSSRVPLEVWLGFFLFVFLRSIDRVFYKRVSDRMSHYGMFFVAFMVPIGTQVMTMILSAAYVWYMRHVKKNDAYTMRRFFAMRSPLAAKGGAVFPQLVLLFNSVQCQLGNTITGVATPYMSVSVMSILMNTTLVFTVLSAVFYTRTTFQPLHYCGCCLIVLSSLVSLNVELTNGGLGQYVDSHGVTQTCSPVWYLVFVVGCFPLGFSVVYNQKWLQDFDLDVIWSSLWGGWWQMAAGFLTFPVNWVKLPSPAVSYSPAGTLSYLKNAVTCMMGVAPTPQDDMCVADGSAALWFGMYLLFTTAFNTLLCWLTKRMSATWATIGSVLCTALASILGSMPLIAGDEAQPLKLEQVLGLAMAAVAMVVYSSAEETRSVDPEASEFDACDSFQVRTVSNARGVLPSSFTAPFMGGSFRSDTPTMPELEQVC